MNSAIGRGQIVIVDGICVLEVLQRIGLSPAFHVYVKRLSSDGYWTEGHLIYDPDKTPDEAVETIAAQSSSGSG